MKRTLGQYVKSILAGIMMGVAGASSVLSPVMAQTTTPPASLLPNAVQQYLNDDGTPIANGKVYYYVPSTTTKKTVWQDPNQTTPQSNPVLLDNAGRPQPAGQTFGTGQYRQKVVDENGVTIWDEVTASTGGGSGGGGGSGSGDGIAVGTILPYDGFVAPTNYMFAAGQAVSRVTYAALMNAITSSQSVICTSGTNVVSNFISTEQFGPTMPVEAACLPPGTVISSVISATSLQVSNNATASGVFTAQVFPSGRGDGATTFNLPDLRGRVVAGRDNMTGSAANRLTPPYFGGSGLAQSGGSQSHVQTLAEMAQHNHTINITDPGHSHPVNITSVYLGINPNPVASDAFAVSAGHGTAGNITGTGTAATTFTGVTATSVNAGSSTAFSVVQATQTTNFIIKVLPDSSSGSGGDDWQVPAFAIPVGRGTGVGFDYVLPNISTSVKVLLQSGDGTNPTTPVFGSVPVAAGGTGQATLTANSVLLGNGSSSVQFAVPANVQGCLTSTSSTTLPSFGSAVYPQCGPVNYLTRVSDLRNLPIPSGPQIFLSHVDGYYNANDGAEGWFYWAPSAVGTDDACTVFTPTSAPATGRWIRIINGQRINVKWCGAKGDGATNDTAAITTATTLALAIKGTLYFPAVSTSYIGQISVDSGKGLTIAGDSAGANTLGVSGGSMIQAPSNTIAVNLFSNNFSGDLQDIHVRDLKILVGGTGTALRIYNGLGITFDNVEAGGFGGSATGCVIHGTAFFTMTNLKCYGAPGIVIGNDNNTIANTGPGTFIGGQFANQAGSGNQPAIVIQGSPLGVNFNAIDYGAGGSTCSITIDGPNPADPGSVSGSLGSVNFYDLHGESNYSTSPATGADICIGQTYAAGHVGVYGGNAWGSSAAFPSGYHNYWMQVFKAQDIVVDGYTVSNLGNGYGIPGGVIRFEGTMAGSYNLRNITKNDVPILYSSASGKLPNTGTATSVNATNGWQAFDGPLFMTGSSSGAVTVQTQAAAGTYNFNLPTSAGTSGDCMKSGGGGASPMTFGPCNSTTATTAYTPTITSQTGTCDSTCQSGLTISTFFKQQGKLVFVRGKISIGASLGAGTPAGGFIMTLPVGLSSKDDGASINASYSSGQAMSGLVGFAGLGTVSFYLNASATPWIASSNIRFSGWYETP